LVGISAVMLVVFYVAT